MVSETSSKIEHFVPKRGAEEQTIEIRETEEMLLRPDKTFRDAVHKDIMLTKLEVKLVDTEVFQRLRFLKQLGPTNLVYPCAVHTRYDHSVGTLFMAQQIIDKVNANPYRDLTISPYDRFLIRLCSLLHDLATLPFGHTLEDEGSIFPSQWADKNRVERLLGSNSEVASVIRGDSLLKKLDSLGQSQYSPSNVLSDIRETLVSIEENTVGNLKKPYVADIVGNTLCADLLDYIRRDMYFTGLAQTYDERFLSYLYITKYKDKPRLVLRLIKPRTGQIRHDVVSETLDLLRLRYSLAEKVYFHHTKIIASAMIISAVNSTVQEKKLSIDNLYDVGDETLIRMLLDSARATPISIHLAKCLLSRRLYKPVYELRYSEEGFGRVESERKKRMIHDLRGGRERYKWERGFETINRLKQPGSIVIYCPGPEMGRKAAMALVDSGSCICPLEEINDERIKTEISTSITKKHLELWKMCVLVDPSLSEEKMRDILTDCEEQFGMPSESSQYAARERTTHLDRYAVAYNKEHPKEQLEIEEMVLVKENLAHMWEIGEDRWLSYENFCKLAADVKKLKKS